MANKARNRTAVTQARGLLKKKTIEFRQLTARMAKNGTRLQQLLRVHPVSDERIQLARARQTAQMDNLKQVRAQVTQARQTLSDALREWVSTRTPDDLTELSADFPLVLFPIRLETRFDQEAAVLKIRIYPDTILAESHDPRLTQTELEAGKTYWGKAKTGKAEDKVEAWRGLVRQIQPPRAAWIVQATDPTKVAKRSDGTLDYSSLEVRGASWDQTPETTLLPDRWIALAYRQNSEVGRAVSQPVQEPLSLGFDPHLPPEQGVDISGDGLKLDSELAWTVDFAQAEKVGMALQMQLGAQDLIQGFDQLLVLGVKTSLTPEQSGRRLEELFEGHHYSAGWAFVPQGTPTNNTETTTTPYPPPDPDGRRSYAVEHSENLNTKDGDGTLLMKALGLSTALVAHIDGANRTEQLNAQAMNRALWPVTFGYFLEQMMAPHVSGTAIDATQDYFVDHVRGRGPLSAFRVRGQLYGVLPVTSLDNWQSRSDTTEVERQLTSLLRQLRPIWQEQINQVPHLGRTSDPDEDLLAILGMDASSREVRIRHLHGEDFMINILNYWPTDPVRWRRAQLGITRPAMGRIGLSDWNPRILWMNFDDKTGFFRHPFVAPKPLSEETGLKAAYGGFNYIRWIREATINELRQAAVPDRTEGPRTLLYLILRHAKLAQLQQRALALQIKYGMADPSELYEAELVDFAQQATRRSTIWERFERPIRDITGEKSLGQFLETDKNLPDLSSLRQFLDALQALEELPTAELERLFTESLDLSAHRLDAWVTSLATKRLESMRQENPTGVHIGAFGWVEDLRPAKKTGFREATLSDGRAVQVLEKNGGYTMAPSMAQASTAAVLRNGYLSRTRDQEARYAINLSSSRVRMGLSLLDAVRQGQPLGAALGYQFERGLHDRELDWFIEPLRRRFPQVANKAEKSGEPADTIAARNVVDGLALHKGKGGLDFNHSDFLRNGQPPDQDQREGVESELHRLDEALDAVTDLLTAESVHQFMQGNTGGVNSSLDAMAKGIRPPEPAIAQQTITGSVLTHRVAIVLGGEAIKAKGWPAVSDVSNPRARAEPYVNGWAGQVFGDPRRVLCWVNLTKNTKNGVPENELREIKLADLGLCPIDILAFAHAAAEGPAPLSELDSRVVEAAVEGDAGLRVEEILYTPKENWDPEQNCTFPEILELARHLNQLLGAARPLQAGDLVTPQTKPLLPTTDPFKKEAMGRVNQASQTLAELAQNLNKAIKTGDPGSLAELLRKASLYGIQGAYPPAQGAEAETLSLIERAKIVQAEIKRRKSAAKEASGPLAKAQAIFGPAFPFLACFQPAQVQEFRQALNAGGGLSPEAPEAKRWLYQSARVRPRLALWRKLDLLTRAIQSNPGTLRVAQLPHRTPVHWVGLPFDENSKPVAGTLSLVLHRFPNPPPADSPWVGLLLDEWSEVIPYQEQMAGLAFHYDAPSAEPPQAILIAVPPDDSPTWTLANLTATLRETFDLAKIRTVDGELLGVLGQLLPAIYVSNNAAHDAITTNFRGALFAEEREL